jgi:hypothetical protein
MLDQLRNDYKHANTKKSFWRKKGNPLEVNFAVAQSAGIVLKFSIQHNISKCSTYGTDTLI